ATPPHGPRRWPHHPQAERLPHRRAGPRTRRPPGPQRPRFPGPGAGRALASRLSRPAALSAFAHNRRMSLAARARHIAPEILLRWSIAVAVATIVLKTLAWWITDSVGLLSDALESLVNLAGASFALLMVKIASRPADDEHPYGH